MKHKKGNKMNAIEKEYDLIFRDKNKNELTRKTIWCYSIIDARRYGKLELANSNINDLYSVIAKRVRVCH